MKNGYIWWKIATVIAFGGLLGFCHESRAQAAGSKTALDLQVGVAKLLTKKVNAADGVRWTSSAPQIAQVFQNGFVVGLKPGLVQVRAQAGTNEPSEWMISVEGIEQSFQDPATLKQYPDNREFKADGRKCYGSELNGQRASDPEEKKFTKSNRVINPQPLRKDQPLDWEVETGAEVYDGAGVLIGTVPPTLKVGDRKLPVSKFNFGASKVLDGRICVYAFSVTVKPTPALAKSLSGAGAVASEVSTSAWMPLDRVVAKEALLERIGLGRARLPALPLEAKGYRVSGGDPKLYDTEFGELSIVKDVASGPVPSHYLRRPSGTINLIYSVPGFGLGGQGVDSFLIDDHLKFYPAKGAKVFEQPTYFPAKHPQAGKVAPQTMTFLYGAVKGSGFEPIYGWIAKEALVAVAE